MTLRMYDIIKEEEFSDVSLWDIFGGKVFDILSANFDKKVFGNENFSYEVVLQNKIDPIHQTLGNGFSIILRVTLKKPNLGWLYDCYKTFADTAINVVLGDSEFKERCDKYREYLLKTPSHLYQPTNEMILLGEKGGRRDEGGGREGVFTQFYVRLMELYYNYGEARFDVQMYMDTHMKNLFSYEEVSIAKISLSDKLSQIFNFIENEHLEALNTRLFPIIQNNEKVDVLPERKKKRAQIVFEALKRGTIVVESRLASRSGFISSPAARVNVPYSLVPVKIYGIVADWRVGGKIFGYNITNSHKDYVILHELNPTVYFEDTHEGYFNENKLGVSIEIGIVLKKTALSELLQYGHPPNQDNPLRDTSSFLQVLNKFEKLGVRVGKYRIIPKEES